MLNNLRLPISGVKSVLYSLSNAPSPIPSVPHEAVTMVIHYVLLPNDDPLCVSARRVFVHLHLFDSDVQPCDEIKGKVYNIRVVERWISENIKQGGSKCRNRYTIHLLSYITYNNYHLLQQPEGMIAKTGRLQNDDINVIGKAAEGRPPSPPALVVQNPFHNNIMGDIFNPSAGEDI